MADPVQGDGRGRRGWRRKWRRAAPERRRAAAASLHDAFRPRRYRGLLWAFLLASLAVHAAAAPFIRVGGEGDVRRIAAADAYLRKVIQTERAKRISRDVRDRVTMPPAPPEPEEAVARVMADSLTSDVEKVTAGLLNVKLRSDLAAYVRSSLADELAAAARDIATGRLSAEEVRALHERFRRQAHEKAIAWRKEYLIEHQEERAAVSTTEWYERDVSPTLFGNMQYQLLAPGRHWPPSAQIWHRSYTGSYGWWDRPNWSDLRSHGMLQSKLGRLRQLLSGRWRHAGGADSNRHPGWPGPSVEQARALVASLKQVHEGRYSKTYPKPAWRDVIYGSEARPQMTFGILEEFHPHRLQQMRPIAEKLDGLWDRLLAAAGEYLKKAEGGAAAEEMTVARDVCMGLIREIVTTAEGLLCEKPDERRAVNWAVRLDALTGPMRDEMYREWVESLVEGLAPLIRDFARGQFKKGIIKHTGGIEQAMKEFPATVLPLLRRDVERMLSRRRFQRRIMDTVYPYRGYHSEVTGKSRPPERSDAVKELAEAKKLVAAWDPKDRPYLGKRRELCRRDFANAIAAVREDLLDLVFSGNLLMRKMGVFLEGVDYDDRVQQKLDARAMALKGRGQDLARLTADGLPDTSAPMVALMLGAAEGDAPNLEPVLAPSAPPGTPGSALRGALRAAEPAWPAAPAGWGFKEQARPKPKFSTPRYEAVPFLPKFPRLDGDLSDWGRIRPLVLRAAGDEPPILVYAAWNYQGFFFGYQVRQHPDEFYWPSLYRVAYSLHSYVLGAGVAKNVGVDWATKGDYFRVLLDTLDARSPTRGDPHTQEFIVFPQGTANTPTLPGVERVIESKRDATRKSYRDIKDACRIFPAQPPADKGPDGSGPYRVFRRTGDGYAVEVFLPRSCMKTPVFSPGWHVGFDCTVATGVQRRRANPPNWAATGGRYRDRPDTWGDLLMLGTDPRVVVQEAAPPWPLARGVVAGHACLVTVIDPDRNIRPTGVDHVIVSAEVLAGGSAASRRRDVEVFVLKETGPNTGAFRGFIRTQPGLGRRVQGVLEVMALDEVVLGYVDVGDARGRRNVVRRVRLPVVAGMLRCARAGSQGESL